MDVAETMGGRVRYGNHLYLPVIVTLYESQHSIH